MYQGHFIGAILLMGGEGRRFGGPTPKQFTSLGKKKIYRHTLDTLLKTNLFDEIILVCLSGWTEKTQKEVGNLAHVVEGGLSRQQSSHIGLKAFHSPPKIVMIHDAVRPFISPDIIQANMEGALLEGAVDTCIPSADTLIFSPDHQTIAAIPKRADYLRGQTPQTFLYEWILEAHETALQNKIQDATDDCQLILASGKPVKIVQGSEKNIKITSEWDLQIAKAILATL